MRRSVLTGLLGGKSHDEQFVDVQRGAAARWLTDLNVLHEWKVNLILVCRRNSTLFPEADRLLVSTCRRRRLQAPRISCEEHGPSMRRRTSWVGVWVLRVACPLGLRCGDQGVDACIPAPCPRGTYMRLVSLCADYMTERQLGHAIHLGHYQHSCAGSRIGYLKIR